VGYEWELSAWPEQSIPYPVDVKVLNWASLGFRYAVRGVSLLFARDEEIWYNFREETWIQHLSQADAP